MGMELATTSVVRFATALAILVGTGLCAHPAATLALAMPPADSGKPAEIRFDDASDMPAKSEQQPKDSKAPKKVDPPQATPEPPKPSRFVKGGLFKIFAPKASQGEPVQVRFEESVSEPPTGKEAPKQGAKAYPTQVAREVPKQAPKEYPTQAAKEAQALRDYPTQAAKEAQKQAPRDYPAQAAKEAAKPGAMVTPKQAPTQATKEVTTQTSIEDPKEAPTEAPREDPKNEIHYDDQLQQASCPTCGDGLLSPRHGYYDPHYGGGCAGCDGGECIPGHKPCNPGVADDTFFGRFWNGLCQCVCCPDPCYEPVWCATANAAFFVDAARPQTLMRFRYDAGIGMIFPDRAEFFWARQGSPGKGPALKKPLFGELGLDYHDFSLYNEAAAGALGLFVEVPYRTIYPEVGNHSAGFIDMNLGTKSLLLDCDLLQLTFQFRTYIPVGTPTKGLGTGHTALEPSLLLTLHLCEDTYSEIQLSEWIPIGGDQQFEGSVFHYHFSLNCLICHLLSDIDIIGTTELNGWAFQGGGFTDPLVGFKKASDATYLSAGPGLRIMFCDRVELGVGSAFALTRQHWADELIRTEIIVKF